MSFHLKVRQLPNTSVTIDFQLNHTDPRRDFSSFAYRHTPLQISEGDFKVFCLTEDFPKLLKHYAFSYHNWCCNKKVVDTLGVLSLASSDVMLWNLIPKNEAYANGENREGGLSLQFLTREVNPTYNVNPADLDELRLKASSLGITLYEIQPSTGEYQPIIKENYLARIKRG